MSLLWTSMLLAVVLFQCSGQADGCSVGEKCICTPCAPGPGVGFGQEASDLKGPAEVADFVVREKIKTIRLYHTYPVTMSAFQGKGVDLFISISNYDIKASGMAWNYNAAEQWIRSNVMPYVNNTPIKLIAVGNEVTSVNDWDLVSQIEPAMRNIWKALYKFRLSDQIKVSTPFGQDILEVTWPPSDGTFRVEFAWNIVLPVLIFLNETNSPFLINIYPFVSYKNDPWDVNLDAALLNSWSPISVDFKTGHVYKNLLFQLLDATVAAMEKMGHNNISLVLSETGWPSAGYDNASPENAAMYNQNLVNLVVKGVGTPLRPHTPIKAFIYSLFNENMKGGSEEVRHYGIFKPDFTPVYDIDWQGEDTMCISTRVSGLSSS